MGWDAPGSVSTDHSGQHTVGAHGGLIDSNGFIRSLDVPTADRIYRNGLTLSAWLAPSQDCCFGQGSAMPELQRC